MADLFADPPALPFDIANCGIRAGAAQIGERLTLLIRLAENRVGFGVAQIVVEAVGDVEIVGEEERAAPERARDLACGRGIEETRDEHRGLDGGRQQ